MGVANGNASRYEAAPPPLMADDHTEVFINLFSLFLSISGASPSKRKREKKGKNGMYSPR